MLQTSGDLAEKEKLPERFSEPVFIRPHDFRRALEGLYGQAPVQRGPDRAQAGILLRLRWAGQASC